MGRTPESQHSFASYGHGSVAGGVIGVALALGASRCGAPAYLLVLLGLAVLYLPVRPGRPVSVSVRAERVVVTRWLWATWAAPRRDVVADQLTTGQLVLRNGRRSCRLPADLLDADGLVLACRAALTEAAAGYKGVARVAALGGLPGNGTWSARAQAQMRIPGLTFLLHARVSAIATLAAWFVGAELHDTSSAVCGLLAVGVGALALRRLAARGWLVTVSAADGGLVVARTPDGPVEGEWPWHAVCTADGQAVAAGTMMLSLVRGPATDGILAAVERVSAAKRRLVENGRLA